MALKRDEGLRQGEGSSNVVQTETVSMVEEIVPTRPSTSLSMKCNAILSLAWGMTRSQEQQGNRLTLLQRDSMQANKLVRPTHAHFAEKKTSCPRAECQGTIL